MKHYEITKHAKHMIKERNIKIEWVERVLFAPKLLLQDKNDSALMHALNYIVEHENRVLRVIYNTNKPWKIVTVFFDRSMKEKL